MNLTSKIIRGVIAPLWAIKESTPYLKYLDELTVSKTRPLEEVKEVQLLKLRSLIAHAISNTDYYRKELSEHIKNPSEMTWDDFSSIPLLTKDDIRANKDGMVARNIRISELTPRKTSGSTGVSLDFYVDEYCSQWKRAVTISYDRWAGWDLGERVGAIWGNPDHKKNWRLYLRNLILTSHIYLDTLKMNEKEMHAFYRKLKTKKPAILFGHAHSLFLFSKFLDNKQLYDIRPNGIISTCMVLHDFERKKIEEIFGCKVTNRYGCEEVSLIACECQKHQGMHLNYDSLIVEFLRDGKPVAAGEPGAIVVTDLTNYGMPFIRYKVGDVGVPSDRTCDCGCTYPLMESLEGRVADYVITTDGNFISGISLTENFAMKLPGIKQMQIIQERIDFLVFRLVKGESFSAQTELDVARLTEERFGKQMEYRIEYVESIQSEISGKYRFCISKLPNPFS
jgi:phenylacetate-CoA ligase